LIRRPGTPKGKREREAPFDEVLQEAIKKLWVENGEHEYVFSFKGGRRDHPGFRCGSENGWNGLA
jgi:integrase